MRLVVPHCTCIAVVPPRAYWFGYMQVDRRVSNPRVRCHCGSVWLITRLVGFLVDSDACVWLTLARLAAPTGCLCLRPLATTPYRPNFCGNTSPTRGSFVMTTRGSVAAAVSVILRQLGDKNSISNIYATHKKDKAQTTNTTKTIGIHTLVDDTCDRCCPPRLR